MKENNKIIIIYIITFILILSNSPLFNGTSIIEMILRAFGVLSFSSQVDTGLYYPTFVMLLIGVVLWIYLRRSAPESKFSKYYFFYCIEMMFVLAIVNNMIH